MSFKIFNPINNIPYIPQINYINMSNVSGGDVIILEPVSEKVNWVNLGTVSGSGTLTIQCETNNIELGNKLYVIMSKDDEFDTSIKFDNANGIQKFNCGIATDTFTISGGMRVMIPFIFDGELYQNCNDMC